MNTITGLFRSTDTNNVDTINDEDDIVTIGEPLINHGNSYNTNTFSAVLTYILQIFSILALITFIGCVITFIIVSIRLTHSINKDIVPLANNITLSLYRISYAIENLEDDAYYFQRFLSPLLTSIKAIAKDIHKIAGIV